MSGERGGGDVANASTNQANPSVMASGDGSGTAKPQPSAREPAHQAPPSTSTPSASPPINNANPTNPSAGISPPTHSTPLPRYSGPAVARDKLHYVSTLRFPRIPVPQPIDRILRVLLHILQGILLPGSQHSFYWAQITAPQAGDCYAIQRQATQRPSDGCEWLADAQILTCVFNDWPLEVSIYTRGGTERQRNPATALARLEYRVSPSNSSAPTHAVPSLVSNLVFVQFVPLISLKGFQPMVTSQPPLVPADFSKAMAGFAARATASLPQHIQGVIRSQMSSAPAASSSAPMQLPSKTINSGMALTQGAPMATETKTGAISSAARGVPSKRSASTVAAATPIAYNTPLFVEEPIESMSLAPIDATDAVERALLRMHARPVPLAQAILSSTVPVNSVDESLEGAANLTLAIREQIRELQEDIQRMTETGVQERDRRQQLKQLLKENSDYHNNNKTLAQLIEAIQPLTRMRISRYS